MHSEVPVHEKIRFRRSDITALDGLPSAMSAVPMGRSGNSARRAIKIALGAVAALVFIAGLFLMALVGGIGDERLRLGAQAAVASLAGKDFTTRIGATNLSFDGLQVIALEAKDVSFLAATAQEEVAHIASVRFGLKFLPLLLGELKLGRIVVEDARIMVPALPARQGNASFPVFNAEGVLDPDANLLAVLAAADQLATTLGERTIDRIDLKNVAIVASAGESAQPLLIRNAQLKRRGEGLITLNAALEAQGHQAGIKGQLRRNIASGSVETLTLEIDAAAVAPATTAYHVGEAVVTLTATRTEDTGRLDIAARLNGIDIDMGRAERFVADADLEAMLVGGSNKIEFEKLAVVSGRSNWNFHGAFGPAPEASDGYRFELVSDGSTIAPEGSPELPLGAVARLAGHLERSGRVLRVEEIGVRSGQGEVRGEMALRFEPGLVPGVALRIEAREMPVGQAKQLWPWFAAHGARNWVVDNVYGGRVEHGTLQLDVPPGRLGNGVPLNAAEMWGEFSIRGTRFDIAGHIPPVRDGNGSVRFDGQEVAIALESGTVFMPGGRTVDASNGKLKIEDARRRPVIGKLEIDVAGEADDVLLLASYDPIDVGRFIDLVPDDISGMVTGKVFADIPLQRGIPIESLDWRVDLSYRDLALARPFQGQMVTAATGSIVVDPQKAVIEAAAHLNGAPATLRLVEPLGQSAVERERRIALRMDDRARRGVAPGLDALLSGSIEVEVNESKGEARAIKASLESALLSIPWVGWSKGSGVPATVDFNMKTTGDRTEISNFRLSGDTFGASGTLSLSGGEVARIRFPSARLNRTDDFSFDMRASGSGYALTIRGRSVDARSLIKLYAHNLDGGTGEGGARPVTLDLEVDAISGFHGEILRDVKLSYSGTGARTDALAFSATTSSGQKVTFRDGSDGNNRTVTIESADAGAVLRFLDIYQHMEGGSIAMTLRGIDGGPLSGQAEARDFWVVNEPRLRSLVSSPASQDGRSLNQTVRGEIDATRVRFERAFALIDKGDGYLNLQRGVLRGPEIGSTFQGSLYDAAGRMDMTGTFMPAYGLNRLFGEIPLIGKILGNGRDRGLIGITFRLAGKAGEPQLQINPLSVIAPGIFRSVFEYR